MFTLIIFIAVLAILVLSHELGHFVAAKKSGMKVYEFGFGFPPRAFGWYRDPETKKIKFVGRKFDKEKAPSTLYSINWLPLGGFVSIKGENGEDEGEDSFVNKPYWKKAITLVAGVAMNFLVAAILLGLGFMLGLPQTTENLPASAKVNNQRLEVLQVFKDKPAETAGILRGDAIIKLDDLENPSLTGMQEYVDINKANEILLAVKRGEEILNFKITPEVYEDTGKGGFGVAISEVGNITYPWYEAMFYRGFEATWLYTKAITVAFYNLAKGLIIGNGAGDAVSGPIGIAVITGQVARLGLAYLIQFTAVLSINLAILNILPIPALDGGRLLFITIGRIFKRQVSLKYEQIAHTVGFALLMLLVLVVTVKDLGQFKDVFLNLF